MFAPGTGGASFGGGMVTVALAAASTFDVLFGPVAVGWELTYLRLFLRPKLSQAPSIDGVSVSLFAHRAAPQNAAALVLGRNVFGGAVSVPMGQWDTAATFSRDAGPTYVVIPLPPFDPEERFIGCRLTELGAASSYDGFLASDVRRLFAAA